MEKDIYHIFGKFVVEFEYISGNIEACARSLLEREGLNNQGAIECILAGMTAEPLSTLVQSLCYECLDLDESDTLVLDNIFASFKKLISKRNDLVHGQHFISHKGKWSQKDDIGDSSFSIKLHKNKRGAARKHFELSIESMHELYSDAECSLRNICKLYNCIEGGCPIRLNFKKIDGNKYLSVEGKELRRC